MMIYEFKSRATGSLVMTSEVAEALLHIIGKQKGPQGVIVPDAMPAAMEALNKAIALQKNSDTGGDKAEDDDGHPKISLAQRALPFIEMMQRAHSAGKEITWGV
jgi:Domain of unknown function (DUF1840)